MQRLALSVLISILTSSAADCRQTHNVGLDTSDSALASATESNALYLIAKKSRSETSDNSADASKSSDQEKKNPKKQKTTAKQKSDDEEEDTKKSGTESDTKKNDSESDKKAESAKKSSEPEKNKSEAEKAPVKEKDLLSGERPVKSFSGNASWYGIPFHGHKTANGEIFNMYKCSAAHLTLPLPTRALVEDPRTGNAIIVRVNDRGPYVKTRVMDLSREAARSLGTLPRGVAYIDITVLDSKKAKSE